MSHFDTLTLAAVTDELRATILDGRIQRVLLPSPLSIALEIYAGHRRHHLLISAHPRLARIHLSSTKPSRGVATATPLLLLLRKYVSGGRIVAIEQPLLERVVLLSIVKRPQVRNSDQEPPEEGDENWQEDQPDDDQLRRCELVVEVMEQRSNIILVSDENIILASTRRVTPQMSRRPVQPREPYELPPPQEKRDPRHATAAGVMDAAQSLLATLDQAQVDAQAQPTAKTQSRSSAKKAQDRSIARALVSAYRGLSPFAAREVVFRATGHTDSLPTPDTAWEQIAQELRSLWLEPWAPSLVPGEQEPLAFAPYILTNIPGALPQPSISVALDAYYSAREQLSDHQQRRTALLGNLNDTRERLERQRNALSGELEQARKLEQLRWEGEMIFAYLHLVQPRQAELKIEDDERIITLNPMLTAVENAQERFRAYDKAKSAIEGVPERLHAVELRLAGLDEMIALLELAEGFEAIETIAQEAAEQGFLPQRTPASGKHAKPKRAAPLRVESSDGYTIYVGRSAGQNEQVTFKLGAPDDLWLHARGIPGAHVLIKSGGRAIPEQTLQQAAGLAAYYSRNREDGAVEIDLARRSQVRRIRGGPIGLVSYHAESTIRANPTPP